MEPSTVLLTLNTLLLVGLLVITFLGVRRLRHQLHEARLELRKHVQEAARETRSQALALHKELGAEQAQRTDTLKALLLDCLIGPKAFLNPVNQQRWVREDLHVVLAIPKTGSTTIHQLLIQAGVGGNIVHRHGISRAHLSKKLEDYLQPPHRPTYAQYVATAIQIQLHENVRALDMNLPRPPRTWYYMGSRDPIAQMLSLCFQRLRSKAYPGDEALLAQLHAQARDPEWQASFDAWFDRECRDTFGFDVFAEEFPHDQGWALYPPESAAPVQVFVFRLEDIPKAADGLAKMHGTTPEAFPISKSHSGENSKHGEAYQRIRKAFRLPLPVLEQIYATRYCRHFYLQPELDAFKEKWAE